MARYLQAHLNTPTPSRAPKPVAYAATENTRALAGMLLAAAMAALLVVADQVIETWTDGQLLAGWVALWTLAFIALALLSLPLRRSAALGARVLAQYAARVRMQRAEAALWSQVRQDPRVMAEVQAAMARAHTAD